MKDAQARVSDPVLQGAAVPVSQITQEPAVSGVHLVFLDHKLKVRKQRRKMYTVKIGPQRPKSKYLYNTLKVPLHIDTSARLLIRTHAHTCRCNERSFTWWMIAGSSRTIGATCE